MYRRSWLLVVVLPWGCAPRVFPATEVAASYLAALRAGRSDAAAALLSTRARGARRPEELAVALRELPVPDGGPTEARELTEVTLTSGVRLRLVREAAGWRMDESLPAPAVGRTVAEALAAFALAVQGERYDLLAKLAPAGSAVDEAGLRGRGAGPDGALLRELATRLAEAPAPSVDEAGGRAVVRLDERREVLLVREAGLWRVAAVR